MKHSPPKFLLAPWETRSDSSSEGTVDIQHAGYDMSAQNNRLWLRETGDPQEGSFVATSWAEPPCLTHWFDPLDWDQHEPMAWRNSLNDILAKGKLARLFFLGPSCELRQPGEKATHSILVGAGGGAILQKWGIDGPLKPVAFLWTREPNWNRFLHTSSLDIWAMLQSQSANKRSDYAFAWQWKHLSRYHIEKLLRRWTDDQINEVSQVLTWWLQMQNRYWNNAAFLVATINFVPLVLQEKDALELRLTGTDGNSVNLPPDELEKAFQLILRRFGLPFRKTPIAQHLQMRHWLEDNYQAMSIRVSTPTTHEQLEAAFKWREWTQR